MLNSSDKRAAIVLSGCGVFDGSEIHEAVVTLLNLQKRKAKVSFFAPDTKQAGTINHLSATPAEDGRNVLVESARIARGNISPLSEFKAEDCDMIIFVGGFGAAKNLCTFAFDGAACSVNPDVERSIKGMLSAGKKLGFMCIAPVIAARVISNGVKLTIGSDSATAKAIEDMGARHVPCGVSSFVKDEKFNVYSTPAYMLASDTAELDAGISAMIAEMMR